MDPVKLAMDGLTAYSVGRDSVSIVNKLIGSFNKIGAKPLYPSLRIKINESTMEFDSGLEIQRKLFSHGSDIVIDLPRPSKMIVYGLLPYMPLQNAFEFRDDKIHLKRDVIEEYGGENIKITMEYPVDNREALPGLVYTSSPRDNKLDRKSDEEYEVYWLQAGLKSVKLLKDIYSEVKVEDVAVKAEVTVKEHIMELFDEDFKKEITMQAKFSSHDRNERARAMAYRKHHIPQFKGSVFNVVNQLGDILQSSHFRRFLSIQKGVFRFNGCERGLSFGDPVEPIYIPAYMDVFSSTDLTLEDPAKDDNLVYRKSQFQKRIRKLIEGTLEQPTY